MSGLFIVLEGIDGAGTTTQAHLLQAYFVNRGEQAVVSPEPSDGPIGKLIRQALQGKTLSGSDSKTFDEQMAYLFAADRYYHLYNERDGVMALTKGRSVHVITPRYYFSSLAYNCSDRAEFELVSHLNQRFPNPDLLVYLDVPVEVSLERIKNRAFQEIYEHQGKLKQVSQNYQNILKNYPDLFMAIDGTQNPDIIHHYLVTFIEQQLRNLVK